MIDFMISALAVPFGIGFLASVVVSLVDRRWSGGRKEEAARGIFTFLASTLLAFNIQTLYDINRLLRQDGIQDLQKVKQSLDPEFLLIFGDHIDSMIEGIRDVVEKRQMRLDDIDQYRYFYRKFLETYPDATFYATSLPREDYFWSPGSIRRNSVEEAIQKHVAGGGHFERIFFTSSSEGASAAEERKVIDLHSQLGIKVYQIDEADVHPQQRRFFLVASNGKIAAEATLAMDNRISELVITVNEEEAGRYLQLFGKLKQNPKLQEYHPAGQSSYKSKQPLAGAKRENLLGSRRPTAPPAPAEPARRGRRR